MRRSDSQTTQCRGIGGKSGGGGESPNINDESPELHLDANLPHTRVHTHTVRPGETKGNKLGESGTQPCCYREGKLKLAVREFGEKDSRPVERGSSMGGEARMRSGRGRNGVLRS